MTDRVYWGSRRVDRGEIYRTHPTEAEIAEVLEQREIATIGTGTGRDYSKIWTSD